MKTKNKPYCGFLHSPDMRVHLPGLYHIENEHGLIGYAFVIKMLEYLCAIPEHGVIYNNKTIALIASKMGLGCNLCYRLINDCIKNGVFSNINGMLTCTKLHNIGIPETEQTTYYDVLSPDMETLKESRVKWDINRPKYLGNHKFLKFWSKYPRKIAKALAYKTWIKINGDLLYDKIMLHLENYLKHIRNNKIEQKYIAYPSTWLNREDFSSLPEEKQTDRLSSMNNTVRKF